MCSLLNHFMSQLAKKFPTTKFLKSISTVCIENYPDKNVPTIFVYFEGEMKKQFVGPDSLRGTNLTLDGKPIHYQYHHSLSTILYMDFRIWILTWACWCCKDGDWKGSTSQDQGCLTIETRWKKRRFRFRLTWANSLLMLTVIASLI